MAVISGYLNLKISQVRLCIYPGSGFLPRQTADNATPHLARLEQTRIAITSGIAHRANETDYFTPLGVTTQGQRAWRSEYVKKLFYRLVHCRKGQHHRSERDAKHDGQHWTSKCRYCGAPLIRNAARKWVLIDPSAS